MRNGLIEHFSGTKEWWLNGKRHRENGPAIEWADGTKYWFLNGKLHREGGPAIEHSDGTKYWFLNDKYYTEEEWMNKVAKDKKERLIYKMNGIDAFLEEIK